jgi:hypothetical protein
VARPLEITPEAAVVLDRVRAGELSYRRASQLIGCSFSTVRYYVDPAQRERHRAADRARWRAKYDTNPEFRRRELDRNRALTGPRYSLKLLKDRRRRGLQRVEQRNRQREAIGG